MELESYRRSWDSLDHRTATERVLDFIDSKMEILLALAALGMIFALTWKALA